MPLAKWVDQNTKLEHTSSFFVLQFQMVKCFKSYNYIPANVSIGSHGL